MECPICFEVFPRSTVDNHVNQCLDRTHSPFQTNEESSSVSTKASASSGSRLSQDGDTTSYKSSSSTKTLDMFFSPNRSKPTSNSFAAKTTSLNETPKASQSKKPSSFKPLADQMRPTSLDEFVGQEHILGANAILRSVIEADNIPSMILWGPPGCGKTSLANVINFRIQKSKHYKFVTMSATNSGVNDVKDVVKIAKNDQVLLQRKTVLFVDEIHRFNKLQQDTFLPYVENGTITLIGATTENPSFSLNSALLSRCRVFVLEKLTTEQVESILDKALEHLGVKKIESVDVLYDEGEVHHISYIEASALTCLAQLTDGDARIALNCLSLTLQSRKTTQSKANDASVIVITRDDISESLQRSHLLYDRQGDEHYNCISALHKSMRGSDGNAALYWLGRILEGGEDPRYVSRRLIRFASEDIGMADTNALNQAVSAHQACQFIGMPECDVVLAQCVVYMSRAPKSIEVYEAYNKVKQCISEHQGPLPGVPLHLRNAPTKLMKSLGYAKGYKYNPMFTEPVEQDYLPECLKYETFLE